MKSSKIVVSKKKINTYSGSLLVAFMAQNEEGTLVAGEMFQPLLDSLAQYPEFTGKKEEFILLYPPLGGLAELLACRRLLLIGLGKIHSVADAGEINESLRIAGGIVAGQCKAHKIDEVGIALPDVAGLNDEMVGEYLTEGILLGDYQFMRYKSKKKDDDSYAGIKKIELLADKNSAAVRKSVVKAGNSASAVCTARDMANEPGNGWTPAHFADYAKGLAERFDLKCTVLENSELKKLGMGGIVAVNQGSETPARLVILEYNPREKAETILLVGKGLTFDSGGISLKPAQGMMDMKYDMCGGAAVITVMEAVGRERPDIGVVAIVPATDNMAGGGAVKPGDIITHYGGITAEIENTDAEGRLILADALAYGIEKFQPDCVIDMATLTGAVVVALGHHYAGLLSNNNTLAERVVTAGRLCGEPFWRLPMGEMYYKQIKSQIADIKNTGGKHAGSITAAEYLHQFVGTVPWAHLDIAGTAWEFTEKSYIPKGPSGFGVRTLITLLRHWENGAFAGGDPKKNKK
jgi:leucyl aminopeptidase